MEHDTKAEGETGYTKQENGEICIEKWEQVVKDNSQSEIGTRVAIETMEYRTGKRTIEIKTDLENENGKYSIREFSEGTNKYKMQKIITGFNKLTENNEKFVYTKDENGNEFVFREINGKTNLRISKNNRGTTIERYDENGNITDSLEYDSKGRAIIGFKGMDEISGDYVEKFFERITGNIPEYYNEGKELENHDKEDILYSAVEATEESTRTSTINTQAENIKQLYRGKDEKSQEMGIE